MQNTPPVSYSELFQAHSFWWLPDRLVSLGRPDEQRKSYKRPVYLLNQSGARQQGIPLSRYRKESSLKEACRRDPFVIHLPAGSIGMLEGDSLILIPWHQWFQCHAVAFSGPTFIQSCGADLITLIADTLRDYIDSCFNGLADD